MKHVRITVIRKVCHKDLMEKFENPIEHACTLSEGQVFISEDGNGKTTASMPLSFKETFSHRAKAVRKLISWLQSQNGF